ncbi:hypothetical protein HYH03_003248 [Edaphochlamys debaryana]|uniref:S1 motif domain-containing protein n=1 Tax=Edaphochlamys debaryana TaxID=47281 RepID=A0A835Y9X9_9CHLO|nr:hypothetical protein HYH03_003248 [Edaphochlamys debaryana]|eukprot:KAG2499065.1 hypothetical protein HYH03_003248 [Edaphochlamys debaryana]
MLRDLAGRTATTQANARNVVARLRPVAGRRQVAFKGVRPSVRVFAEAPAGGKAAEAAIALADVKEGSEYEGTVTAVEEFGAFVNFGSTTNGLVHISKLAAGFTKNAKDVVSVGQKVTVKVLSVDAAKNRVSLSLSGAAAAPAGAESSASDEVVDFADDIKEEKEQQDEEEEDVEVELEDGQFEVRADLPGFEDIPFVMEEDVEEFSEAAISALEANLDAAEIQYQLENPPYLAEVAGTVSRVENYGIFLDFEWNGKTLTGLLPREEMKVPSALLAEDVKAALRAEWADTEFEMPEYAEVSDDQLNVAKYYKVGDSVAAFVLESQLVSDKIQLTHFTDEEVAGEAVELFEELDEDEDEELDTLINDAEEALAEEALAFEPDALLEDDEDGAIAAVGGAEFEDYDEERIIGAEGNFQFGVTRAGLIKGKNGYQVSPMGLPSRGTDEVNANGVAILGAQEVDFGGDVVQLFDYFDSAAYDAVPKDALKRVGLKMSYNEAGEAEFTEREGHEDDEDALLSLLYDGDVEKRAADLVADLLDDDEDEAELPARAGRRPVVLAAAVQSQ